MKDYYKILDLEHNATETDIKKAYRKLAMKWHPDVNNNSSANARFIEINEAYEILISPSKRKEYDMYFSENNKNETSSLFRTWQQEAQNNAKSYSKMNIHEFNNKILKELKLAGSYSGSFGFFTFLIFGIIINIWFVSKIGPSALISVVVFIGGSIWFYNSSLKNYFDERKDL